MTVNVALTTLGSTCYRDGQGNPLPNSIDGNDATLEQVIRSPLDGMFFEYHLASPATVVSVKVLQSTNAIYQASSIVIQASTDQVVWDDVGGGFMTGSVTYFAIDAVNATYWRIYPIGTPGSGWRLYSLELWGNPEILQPPLVGSSISQVLDWLYTNGYQQAADKLEDLDPGWTFSIAETFMIAGMGQLVQLCSQILAEVQALASGGGGDNEEVLDQIVDLAVTVVTGFETQGTSAGLLAAQVEALDFALFNESQVRVDGLVTFLTNALEYNRTNDNTNTGGLVTHINDKAAEIIAALPAEVDFDLQPVLTAVAGVVGDVADAVNPHTTAAKDSINGNVDAAEAAILDAIAEVQADTDSLQTSATTALADLNEIQATLAGLVIPTSSGLRWPGSESVTLSNPVVLSEPTTITADCHGCIVDVLVVPSGQSVQHADTATRYKGIAWLAFESDRGDWEALQQINLGRQVLLSKELEEASALAVYCKPGAQLRVTPFTLNPA